MKAALKIGTLVLVGVFAVVYIFGSLQIAKNINTNIRETDQKAYLNFVEKMRKSFYTYLGKDRMPCFL